MPGSTSRSWPRKLRAIIMAGALPILGAAFVAGQANAAAPAMSCPSSGAACLYSATNFNGIYDIVYPGDAVHHNQPAPRSVRDRLPYHGNVLCMMEYGNPRNWTYFTTQDYPSVDGWAGRHVSLWVTSRGSDCNHLPT